MAIAKPKNRIGKPNNKATRAGACRTMKQKTGDRKRSATNRTKASRKGPTAFSAYIKRKRSK